MKLTSLIAAALMLAACGQFGTVNQGRVVAYDRAQGMLTLISDSDRRIITLHIPADPNEMGPDPQPGGLLQLDCAHAGAVLFDPANQSLRTIPCASPEFASLPPESRRFGDEIRYYYKDPVRALRLMNVTKTDVHAAARE